MPIYRFYWDNGEQGFLMEINADVDTVRKLLFEYRKLDEYYNIYGWADFLESRNIKARFIEVDNEIYF